ncbi:MAG: UvrD-helicase domain-containing protein [Candidatus Wallbacteria bacterium]
MANKLSGKQAETLDLSKDFSIAAGAGSGKTTVIIEKIFNIITSGYKVKGLSIKQQAENVFSGLLCITFTNKAANELYERIAKRLLAESLRIKSSDAMMCDEKFLEYVEYIDYIYANINQLNISTMDAFFASVLRNNALELNLPADFKICAGGDSQLMFKKAVNEVIAFITRSFEEKKYEADGGNRDEDDGKIWKLNQVYRVYNDRNSMFEVFWNLYGKNIYLSYPAFSFKSKDELGNFLNIEITEKTKILTDYYQESLYNDRDFTATFEELFDNKGLFSGKSLEKVEGLFKIYQRDSDNQTKINDFFTFFINDYRSVRYPEELSGLSDKITHFRDLLKKKMFDTPESAREVNEFEFDFLKSFLELFDDVRDKYAQIKKNENMLDFFDVEHILRCNAVLLDRIAPEFKHILIDEFQDTNVVQVEMIKRLWKTAKLTVVGDGMQSIYRFRNADSSLFRAVTKEIISKSGVKISLDDNYRSSSNVLDFINLFFDSISGIAASGKLCNEMPLKLVSKADEAKVKKHEVAVEIALISAGENKTADETNEISDNVFRSDNEVSENGQSDELISSQYEFTARRIRELVASGGYRYGDIMVLMARMTHVARLEECLKDISIPYYVHKSRNFYEKAEVYDFLNLLRSIVNLGDNYSLIGVLRSPIFAVPDYAVFEIMNLNSSSGVCADIDNACFFEKLKYLYDNDDFKICRIEPELSMLLKSAYLKLIKLAEYSRSLRPLDFLIFMLDEINVEACYGNSTDGIRAAGNLRKIAEQVAASYNTDTLTELIGVLESFIDIAFSEEESQVIEDNSDMVKIMTVHQAKGLESKVVFIPELEAKFNKSENISVSEKGFVSVSIPDFSGESGDASSASEISRLQLYHQIINEYEKLQNLFERKRLFYVAMTRAKELLIMAGTFDYNKKSKANANLTPEVFGGSWIDWILKVTGVSAEGLSRIADEKKGVIMGLGDKKYRLFSVIGRAGAETAIYDFQNKKSNIENLIMLDYKKNVRAESIGDECRPVFTFSDIYKRRAPDRNKTDDTQAGVNDFKVYKISEKENENIGSFIGTICHRVLEEIIKNPNLLNEPGLAEKFLMCDFSGSASAAAGIKNIKKYITSLIDNLKAAITHDLQIADIILNKGQKSYLIEHNVTLERNDVRLNGICDLLIFDDKNVKIIDFKVGNAEEVIKNENIYNLYKKQLYFYGYCILNNGSVKNYETLNLQYYLLFLSADLNRKIVLHEIKAPEIKDFNELEVLYKECLKVKVDNNGFIC